MKSIWYGYKGKPYSGELPPFYRVEEFEWASLIEASYPMIREELEAYIQNHEALFKPYFNSTLSEKPKAWKTSNFIFWSREVKENSTKIPDTYMLFSRIRGLTSMGISMLEPGAAIKPHYGDTDAIIRCHLGLRIPAPSPVTALRVGTEVKGWEEGRLLLFCDAWEHESWNYSEHQRYTLIFDVIHPAHLPQKRRICSNVRSWLDLQKVYERYAFIRRAPAMVKIIFRQILRLKYIFN